MKLEEEIAQKKFTNEYQKVAVNLIYTCNWLQSFYAHLFKPHGITVQQYNILRILRGQFPKPASVKLLRERMLDKMSDASRLVEKLRLKNFVERKTSSMDRRNVDVLITQKGLDALAELDKLDTDFEKYLSTISLEEAQLLNQLLDKLRG